MPKLAEMSKEAEAEDNHWSDVWANVFHAAEAEGCSWAEAVERAFNAVRDGRRAKREAGQ